MSYGVTDTGFVRKRLPDIKTDLETAIKAVFGEAVNLAPQSVFGQLVGIFAEREASIWEIAEAVYYSQYRNSAEGFSLDNVASLVGITRLAALSTTVIADLLGTEGTTVTAGSRASIASEDAAESTGGEQFALVQDVLITKAATTRIVFSVNTVSNTTLYRITIDGANYDYTSDGTATESEILNGLQAVVDAISGVSATVVSSTLVVVVDDHETTIDADTGTANLDIDSVESPGSFAAVNTGPIACPVGSLHIIETAVSGWSEITNRVAGSAGRDLESDADLRDRIANAAAVLGAGTVSSIESRLLQEVDGVTAARVFENRDTGIAIIYDDGGTYTSGSISATINGVTTATVSYNSDKDTTLGDLATAIEALTGVVSAEYDTTLDRFYIITTEAFAPTYSINDGSVVGTITFEVGDTRSAPAHSIEVFVEGGTDQNVAEKIWEVKPSGIQTHGDDFATVQDSNGDDQVIYFSRPVTQYAHLEITITKNTEETYPTDGDNQIKANVVEYGEENLGVGDNFILQKFVGPVFEVSGIATVVIRIAVTATAGGTPSWGTSNISIPDNEVLAFATTRVTVIS